MKSFTPTVVMKFGGTSVEDAAAFRRVARLVRAERDKRQGAPVVVVSAMSRVTNALLAATDQARDERNTDGALRSLDEHFARHAAVAAELLDAQSQAAFNDSLSQAKGELAQLLQSVAARAMPFAQLQDVIVSYGERLSSALLAEVLRATENVNARYVDARRCIITDGDFTNAAPLIEETNARTRAELLPLVSDEITPVLGGFIAATREGATTTLGRGGSDYTAALVGAALGSSEVQIWTDVTGVLTADPRIVSNAHTIARLSYNEAAELAYFGAKVLHPKTIQPAVEQRIPVRICNSRQPEEFGTLVTSETDATPQAAKAIAHKTGVTTLQISSARMLGAYGFLRALFEIFDRHRTVVDVVTTSEVSVSVSLDDTQSLDLILRDLRALGDVNIERGRAIVCVVGEGLRSTPGVAARVFTAIGDVNVTLISQGASSVNLTFAVDERDAATVVRRLHGALFDEPIRIHAHAD